MYLLIVRNNSNTGAVSASGELAAHLAGRGIGCGQVASFDLPRTPGMPLSAEEDRPGLLWEGNEVDLVVALGGDGTVLRSARMVSGSGVPILGINFGHLGFLSNPSDDGVCGIVDAALVGEVTREARANLHVEIESARGPEEGEMHDGEVEASSYFALNELAVTRGALGRIIDLDVSVDEHHFAHMRGDGVVIASSTGSTAYALSAGGPLVAPSHTGMTVVPLASHSLKTRPVVTAPGEAVVVELNDTAATRQAALFIDGDYLKLPGYVRKATVTTGTAPTVLLRYRNENFYTYASKTFL